MIYAIFHGDRLIDKSINIRLYIDYNSISKDAKFMYRVYNEHYDIIPIIAVNMWELFIIDDSNKDQYPEYLI